VAIGQLSACWYPWRGAKPVQQLITDFKQLGQTNLYTLATSIAVLVVIVGARRINKKIPGALIAVIGAIGVSYLVNLASYGVAVLGTVPAVSENWLAHWCDLECQRPQPAPADCFLDVHCHPGAERGYLTRVCTRYSEASARTLTW